MLQNKSTWWRDSPTVHVFPIQIIQLHPYCFLLIKLNLHFLLKSSTKKTTISLFVSCLFFSSVPRNCIPGATACADLNWDIRWIARLCTNLEGQNLAKTTCIHAHICAQEWPCWHMHTITSIYSWHDNSVNSQWPSWCYYSFAKRFENNTKEAQCVVFVRALRDQACLFLNSLLPWWCSGSEASDNRHYKSFNLHLTSHCFFQFTEEVNAASLHISALHISVSQGDSKGSFPGDRIKRSCLSSSKIVQR